jgi:hypothetical protein
MKRLRSLLSLSLTLFVALPSYSQTVWRFDSYQEGDRVYFSTATYEQVGEGEQLKTIRVSQESSELLTLPDDVRERQDRFFGERDDVIFKLPSISRNNISVTHH